MKKMYLGIILICLSLLICACGGKTDSAQSTQTAAETESKTEESVESADEKSDAEETVESAKSAGTESETEEAAYAADASDKQGQTDEAAAAEAESNPDSAENDSAPAEPAVKGKLLYMGHSSIRITTPEEKVIYIDPYAGEGYEPAADLILVTHGHYDHYDLDKVGNRNPDCRIITWQEAHTDGVYQTFDPGFASVEAVEAGNNDYHNINECVGYIVTLTDGTSIYVTGDTSTTEQMSSLAEKEIDYAFFCCDGVYNMGLEEAAKCAEMVKAKHNIPYHMVPADSGAVFDRSVAEQFNAPDVLIIEDGQEIELE